MRRYGRTEDSDNALLGALAQRLRRIADGVRPRPDFQSSLRTSLLMEASTALVPDPSRPAPAPERTVRLVPRRRMAAASAVIATALGLGGVTSASASTIPGDTLYPVKRAAERVELAFHRDLADRGAFKLELAERRLDEARELSKRGSDDMAAQSVREFQEAAADGEADLVEAFRNEGDTGSVALLNQFTQRTEPRLDALAAELPAESSAAVDEAKESVQAIGSRTEELQEPTQPAESPGTYEPEPAPEPEPEPAEPPSDPAVPAPSSPSASPNYSSSTEDEDTQDDEDDEDEDEDDESDEESDEEEPTPEPTPTPSPTPTPTPTEPTPSPEPTPTPTPTPEPTDPPTLLDIVPETLEGVTEGVGGLLENTIRGLG